MDICIDPERIKPGQIFIPVTRNGLEGRSFIPKVIEKGARVLDVDLWSHAKKYRQKLSCHVILVAGTTGKSTTKNRLASILSRHFTVQNTQNESDAHWAVPLAILRADSLTDILLIEATLKSKEAFKQLVSLVRPTHVVMTNIGPAHSDVFKTLRTAALTLAQVFRPKLAWESESRYAFLNHSTPYYDLLKDKAESDHFTVFPFKGSNSLDQNLNLCQLVGRHFGIATEDIQKGLFSAEPITYHPQPIPQKSASLIADLGPSNPLSVSYALTYLAKNKGRKILVFGGMPNLGASTQKYHHTVIDQSLDADVSLVFAYGELTRELHSEALNITHYERKESLIKSLLMEIKSGDVILVKAEQDPTFVEIVERIRT